MGHTPPDDDSQQFQISVELNNQIADAKRHLAELEVRHEQEKLRALIRLEVCEQLKRRILRYS